LLFDVRRGFEQELCVLCLISNAVPQSSPLHEFLGFDDV